jgi:hypothetical protein
MLRVCQPTAEAISGRETRIVSPFSHVPRNDRPRAGDCGKGERVFYRSKCPLSTAMAVFLHADASGAAIHAANLWQPIRPSF